METEDIELDLSLNGCTQWRSEGGGRGGHGPRAPALEGVPRRGSRILERGGVWVINWQCAHRRCAPLGGLKACPLGTFEILDAFSCNLVHILSKN